ncbi:hypothetical protein HK102_009964 [Quaeritorhiza haematococci]|nr:hypothetical protein HK102_009964 [Quaeritorhiza haematococci]
MKGMDVVICPVHAIPPVPSSSFPYICAGASYSMIYSLLDYPVGVVPSLASITSDDKVQDTWQYVHGHDMPDVEVVPPHREKDLVAGSNVSGSAAINGGGVDGGLAQQHMVEPSAVNVARPGEVTATYQHVQAVPCDPAMVVTHGGSGPQAPISLMQPMQQPILLSQQQPQQPYPILPPTPLQVPFQPPSQQHQQRIRQQNPSVHSHPCHSALSPSSSSSTTTPVVVQANVVREGDFRCQQVQSATIPRYLTPPVPPPSLSPSPSQITCPPVQPLIPPPQQHPLPPQFYTTSISHHGANVPPQQLYYQHQPPTPLHVPQMAPPFPQERPPAPQTWPTHLNPGGASFAPPSHPHPHPHLYGGVPISMHPPPSLQPPQTHSMMQPQYLNHIFPPSAPASHLVQHPPSAQPQPPTILAGFGATPTPAVNPAPAPPAQPPPTPPPAPAQAPNPSVREDIRRRGNFNFLGILGVEEYNAQVADGVLMKGSKAGIQVVARRYEEEKVLAAMQVIRRVLDKQERQTEQSPQQS